ncbi:MAG: hypothetical protein QOJ98_2217, partial [Acidobacteriota bacterium]|nr:hypothetical protein [Acidobacteriota bacterium]
MTIRRRLVLLSAVAVAVAIAIASVAVYVLVRSNLRGQVDAALRSDQPKAFFVSTKEGGGPGPADVIKKVAIAAEEARSAPVPTVAGEKALSAIRGQREMGVGVALPPEKFGAATGVAQVVTRNGNVVAPVGGFTSKIPVTDATFEVKAGRKTAVLDDQRVSGVHLRVLTAALTGGELL